MRNIERKKYIKGYMKNVTNMKMSFIQFIQNEFG